MIFGDVCPRPLSRFGPLAGYQPLHSQTSPENPLCQALRRSRVTRGHVQPNFAPSSGCHRCREGMVPLC